MRESQEAKMEAWITITRSMTPSGYSSGTTSDDDQEHSTAAELVPGAVGETESRRDH